MTSRTVRSASRRSGIIAVLQTFGDRKYLHQHLHFLITEGGAENQIAMKNSRQRLSDDVPATT
jgi:hypothetical protein